MTIHTSIRCQVFQYLEDCYLLFSHLKMLREFIYRPGTIWLIVQRKIGRASCRERVFRAV